MREGSTPHRPAWRRTKQKVREKQILTRLDRLVLRTLVINGVFLIVMLYFSKATAIRAIAQRGDWMLDGHDGAFANKFRGMLLTIADKRDRKPVGADDHVGRETRLLAIRTTRLENGSAVEIDRGHGPSASDVGAGGLGQPQERGVECRAIEPDRGLATVFCPIRQSERRPGRGFDPHRRDRLGHLGECRRVYTDAA